MNLKVSITGQKEIDDVLSKLPLALTHTILSNAHAAAAKPLVLKEQLTAPEGPTGNLIDSIGVEKATSKKASQIGLVTVGPRRRGQYKGYAAHLVEYGTKERKLLGRGKYKAGTSRGLMPADPFIKPSFDSTKKTVEGNIAQSIAKVLLRTMKRYIKK